MTVWEHEFEYCPELLKIILKQSSSVQKHALHSKQTNGDFGWEFLPSEES